MFIQKIKQRIYSFFSFKEERSNLLLSDKFFLSGISLIVAIGIYSVYDIEKYADILFWDETLYMQKGLQLWNHPVLDWGPFYNVWYKLLSYCTHDKIELYYLNIKILCVLLPVMLFIFLMVYNMHPLLSFFASILFLFSYLNLPVWPKVSHWCLVVFLISMIISKLFNSVYLKFTVILIGMVLCSYIRPEFYLAFLLFAAFTVVHLILYRQQYAIKKSVVYLVGLTSIYVAVKLVGNPTKTGGNGRMLITFGQHFALNYCRWNHITNKPFWIDWVFYLQDNFLNKPKGDIISNIAHHLLSNIGNYIKAVGKIFTSFVFPVFHKKLNIHSILLAMVAIGIVLKFSTIEKLKKEKIKAAFQTNSSVLKVLFIWCIPTFASSIIAYPRDHYVILQVPFFLILFILLISSFIKTGYNIKLLLAVAVLLFFAKPKSNSFDYFDLLREQKSLCNITTANYLRTHYPTQPIKVFDFEGNINSILTENFSSNSVDFFTTGATSVSRYIDSAKMDIIYITPSLLNSTFTKNDTLLHHWIESPATYGYHAIKTGTFEPYLLSRLP